MALRSLEDARIQSPVVDTSLVPTSPPLTVEDIFPSKEQESLDKTQGVETPFMKGMFPTYANILGTYINQSGANEINSINKLYEDSKLIKREGESTSPVLTQDLSPSPPSVYWEDIWAHVLKAEGGYANNPLDPGGETKFGISKSAYPNLDIRSLTSDDAKAIFKADYFDRVQGDLLLKINPGVAAHVADMAFNAGPVTAIHLLYDSVGLPRKDSITDSLIDRLNGSEQEVDNYSKARLAYYSSLYNAPTFIRGWVNRVSELNKSLGLKGGLSGAYAAARDLDVDYLVQNQYGSIRNAQPRFRDLDTGERGYLRERNRMLGAGYETAMSTQPATIDDRAPSSILDILKATYNSGFFVNTVSGLDELINREAMKASEQNRKALGGLFDKSLLEKATFGLYGGVLSLNDFEKEVEYFKKEYPSINLPFTTREQVHEKALERALEIEGRYDALSNAPMNSVSGFANRIGQVLFGYLPGQVVSMASDPYELAMMLATGGTAGTFAKVGKLASLAFLGEGALQIDVQNKRKEIGLDGGFTQGLANAASAGAGVAAVGGLALGAQKLWKLGSKASGKAAESVANQVDDIVSKNKLTPDTLYIKQEANDLKEVGKIYQVNPHGDDFGSKVLLETRLDEAAKDIALGKPVRNMTDDIRKFVGTDKRFVADMTTALKDLGPDGEVLAEAFKKQSKYWNTFKKNSITRSIYNNIEDIEHSFVPVTNKTTHDIYTFKDVDSARKFLNSGEAEELIGSYAIDIAKNPKGDGYYLIRHADLEPSSRVSGRMAGDDVAEDIVNGVKVTGFKDSDDLLIAKKYEDYSRVRDFMEPKVEEAPISYPADKSQLDAQLYNKQINDYIQSSKSVPSLSAEDRLIRNLEALEQEHIKAGNKGPAMMDIGDTLGVEEKVSVRDFIDEIKEDRAALTSMTDCMV